MVPDRMGRYAAKLITMCWMMTEKGLRFADLHEELAVTFAALVVVTQQQVEHGFHTLDVLGLHLDQAARSS